MRRPLGILGLTLALTALAGPAPAAESAIAPAGLDCSTALVGVDADRRVVTALIEDGQVTETEVGRDPLPFDPVGLAYSGTRTIRHGFVLTLDATTWSGLYRQVEVTDRDRTVGLTAQPAGRYTTRTKRLRPRLIAGTLGYHVFTVNRDEVLQRWTRTLAADGRIRYAQRTVLADSAADLATLQSAGRFEVNGVDVDYLVATTTSGGLQLFRVPVRHPERTRARTLATEGYAGVTGLSAGTCDGTPRRVVLTAIDPVTGTATWTTIRDIRRATPETTRLRGAVTGADSWALHAVF